MAQTRFKLALALVLLGSAVACAPLNRPAHAPPCATVEAHSARLYFTLPQGFPLVSEKAVVENGHLLGILTNKQHFVLDVAAGEHTFLLIGGSNEEALYGNFEPGKTYHIRIFLMPGAFGSRCYWKPLESRGDDLLSRQKEIAGTVQVELEPARIASWEDENKDDIDEYMEELASGEEKPILIDSLSAL